MSGVESYSAARFGGYMDPMYGPQAASGTSGTNYAMFPQQQQIPQDTRNDGKFDLGNFLGNIVGGIVHPVVDIFTDPKKLLLAGGTALACFLCPPLGVVALGAGAIATAFSAANFTGNFVGGMIDGDMDRVENSGTALGNTILSGAGTYLGARNFVQNTPAAVMRNMGVSQGTVAATRQGGFQGAVAGVRASVEAMPSAARMSVQTLMNPRGLAMNWNYGMATIAGRLKSWRIGNRQVIPAGGRVDQFIDNALPRVIVNSQAKPVAWNGPWGNPATPATPPNPYATQRLPQGWFGQARQQAAGWLNARGQQAQQWWNAAPSPQGANPGQFYQQWANAGRDAWHNIPVPGAQYRGLHAMHYGAGQVLQGNNLLNPRLGYNINAGAGALPPVLNVAGFQGLDNMQGGAVYG